MNTEKLEEGSRLLDSVSWSAILSGTVIALALQAVLLMFGYALTTSVGDGVPGGGYAVWMVVVELCAIAVGAALAARLSHVMNRGQGMAAGVMTWAVALVLAAVFQGLTMTRALGGSGSWAPFIGAVVSLVAAVIGGSFGSRLGHATHGSYDEPTTHPIAPVH